MALILSISSRCQRAIFFSLNFEKVYSVDRSFFLNDSSITYPKLIGSELSIFVTQELKKNPNIKKINYLFIKNSPYTLLYK